MLFLALGLVGEFFGVLFGPAVDEPDEVLPGEWRAQKTLLGSILLVAGWGRRPSGKHATSPPRSESIRSS